MKWGRKQGNWGKSLFVETRGIEKYPFLNAMQYQSLLISCSKYSWQHYFLSLYITTSLIKVHIISRLDLCNSLLPISTTGNIYSYLFLFCFPHIIHCDIFTMQIWSYFFPPTSSTLPLSMAQHKDLNTLRVLRALQSLAPSSATENFKGVPLLFALQLHWPSLSWMHLNFSCQKTYDMLSLCRKLLSPSNSLSTLTQPSGLDS